jgi:hypothetical protein
VLIDGPFAETREHLAGYTIIEALKVSSRDIAATIQTRRAP